MPDNARPNEDFGDEKHGVLSFSCIANVPKRQRARRSVVGCVLGCVCAALAYSAAAWALSSDVKIPVQSALLHRVPGASTEEALLRYTGPDGAAHACPDATELAVFQAADGGSCVLPTCVPLRSNATVRTLVAYTYTVNGAETCTLRMSDVPTQASAAKRSSRASTFALLVVLFFAAPTLIATVYQYEGEEVSAVRRASGVRADHWRARHARAGVREHPAWSQAPLE